MARALGPSEASREVKAIDILQRFKAKPLRPVTFYTDAAGTILADILTYPGGVAYVGSIVYTDAYSKLPIFQFPDGVDVLYGRCDGGPLWPVYAREDDRLDALERSTSVSDTMVYNVRAYGTFTTAALTLAAIQNAIDTCSAAGGGIVFLPPGQYSINAPITPKSNVRLRGAGDATVISVTINAHIIFWGQAGTLSNFAVEDMKFLGPVNQTVSVPTRNRTVSGLGCDVAIWIDGDLDTVTPGAGTVTNIAVHRVTVEGTTWLPIRLFGIRGKVVVTESLFYNCMDAGFGFNEEVICSNNTSKMSADNGFSISRGNKKVTCTGNTVENAAFDGIWLSGFIGTVGPEDFSCTGNTIKGCGQRGIALMDAPTYGAITGNTIDKGGYRGYAEQTDDTTCCGIFVRGTSNNPNTPTTFTKGVLIAANLIRNAPRAGVYLNGATGLDVSGNLIIDCGSQYFADGTTQVTSSFTSTNIGVLVDVPSTVTNCRISNNTVTDTRSSPGPFTNRAVFPSQVDTCSISNNLLFNGRNSSLLPVTMKSSAMMRRTGAEETIPRHAAINLTGITMSTGALRFSYFIASRSRVITQLSITTGNTAAGATPTLIKYGLYRVASNGDLTQIGVTANDTALFAATGTPYAKALTSSATIYEDQLYAIAAIVVTGATAPTVAGCLPVSATDLFQDPRESGVFTGQTDLLSSYTAAQIQITQSLFYAAAIE